MTQTDPTTPRQDAELKPCPMDGSFTTVSSMGHADPAERMATISIQFRGEGASLRANAARDYLHSLVMADRAALSPAPEAGEEVDRIRAYASHANELQQGTILVATSDLRALLAALSSTRSAGGEVEQKPFMWAYESVDDGRWQAFNRQLRRADGSICPGVALYRSPQPARPTREEVAAIIDEEPFLTLDGWIARGKKVCAELRFEWSDKHEALARRNFEAAARKTDRKDAALSKADAILALFHPTEPATRSGREGE